MVDVNGGYTTSDTGSLFLSYDIFFNIIEVICKILVSTEGLKDICSHSGHSPIQFWKQDKDSLGWVPT